MIEDILDLPYIKIVNGVVFDHCTDADGQQEKELQSLDQHDYYYNKDKMLRILALLLALIVVRTVPNYQERILYDSFDEDNLCDNGQEDDKMILNFNLDGFKQKRIVASGKTGCSQWIVEGWQRTMPVDYWAYIELPLHYIQFN